MHGQQNIKSSGFTVVSYASEYVSGINSWLQHSMTKHLVSAYYYFTLHTLCYIRSDLSVTKATCTCASHECICGNKVVASFVLNLCIGKG